LQVVSISLVNAVASYLIFVYIIAWLKLLADIGASIALQINSLSMAITDGAPEIGLELAQCLQLVGQGHSADR
jgi:hypothetical protein